MDSANPAWMWITIGGLRLRLLLRPFCQGGHSRPKILVVARYYTIAAGRRFLGRTLKAPYTFHPGWLIGCRASGNGRGDILYHTSSIYLLASSFAHSGHSEKIAKGRATVGTDTAVDLIRDLLAYWPLTAPQRRQLTLTLGSLEESLSRAYNPYLRDADEAVRLAAGFRDRTGRPNPGASAARLARASRLIDVRLAEITRIVPHLSRWEVTVVEEIARIHREFLDRALKLLVGIRKRLRSRIAPETLRWARSCLREVLHISASVQVAPFYRNARYIEAEIRAALEILADTRRAPEARAQAIRPIVDTMVRSLAFKRARRTLEHLIREVDMHASARGGRLTKREGRMFGHRVARFAQDAVHLNETGFKRPRLSRLQQALIRSTLLLARCNWRVAKGELRKASALL